MRAMCRQPRKYRRLVEKQLGRRLTSQEVVHHKNGDYNDNRLENLQVMPMSEHSSMHGAEEARKTRLTNLRFYAKLEQTLNDPQDILWSQLQHIDLSEIAA